jgi:hypothetical protein
VDYRFAGKRETFAVGICPQLSLKEARECRYESKRQLSEGGRPTLAKKGANEGERDLGWSFKKYPMKDKRGSD